MPNDFKRISYRKNPLLFILCVADTLEPSKRFLDEKNGTRYTNRDLLQKISIDYNKVKNEVTVYISKELFDSDEGRKYKNDIETMEKWWLYCYRGERKEWNACISVRRCAKGKFGCYSAGNISIL